jgi:hypothetical protein
MTQAAPFDITKSQLVPHAYYLVWRPRPTQPWQSEEYISRIDAHNQYFALIQRGYEAYLEKRQCKAWSA